MAAPCKTCEKRTAECHADCHQYGRWKFERAIMKRKMEKDVKYIYQHTVKKWYDEPYQHRLSETRRI